MAKAVNSAKRNGLVRAQNEAIVGKAGYHELDVRERSTARHAGCIGLVALLHLWCLPCRASEPDRWLGQDKALHFSTSAIIAGDSYAVTSLISKHEVVRAGASSMLSFAVGAAKEVWDKVGDGDPSLRDLTWDVVGAATGTALSWLVDRLLF